MFLSVVSKKDKQKPFSYLDHSGHVVNIGQRHEDEKEDDLTDKHELTDKHDDDEKEKGDEHKLRHNSLAHDIDQAMSETKWEFKDRDFSVSSDHSTQHDGGHTKPKHGHTETSAAKSSPAQTNQFEVLTSESKGLETNIFHFYSFI